MTLDEYLRVEMRRRWRWGDCDCVQFGLGWARERTGRPLPAFFDYSSRNDATRALQARGGLAAIVREWMALNGFASADEPDDGDIGLAPLPVVLPDSVSPVAVVIRRGPWWLTREAKGVGGIQLGNVPTWRVP